MRRYTPLALTIIGGAVLSWLAFHRLLEAPTLPLRALMLAGFSLYIAWMIWESRISVAEISKSEQDNDRGTMEMCAAVKLGLLFSSLALPSFDRTENLQLISAVAAILLMAAGIALRTSGIRAMAASYSHRIRFPEIPLITSGPYAHLRHPAYSGTLLIHMAVVLQLPNYVSCAALVLWFISVWYRTRVEEQYLLAIPEYQAYSQKVTGVWWPRSAAGWQAAVPLLLSGLFVIAIIALFGNQILVLSQPLQIALGIVVALYLLWLVIEAKIAKRELSHDRTGIDKGTMELYAAGRAITVIVALALPNQHTEFGAWYGIGVALFAGGVAFRLNAIRTLGQFYSHRVRLQTSHKIVSTGPYRILRHPAYTGMIASHLGFVICFYHPVALAVWAFILVPAVIARIIIEERALFSLDGYALYAKSRRRLIPLVW